MFNSAGREWEAHNVKRNVETYLDRSDRLETAQKTLGLVQTVIAFVIVYRKFRSKK